MVRCAMCNEEFDDYGDGDNFCRDCEATLEEFFDNPNINTDGDPEVPTDWDLLAEEMRKGLIMFDGNKLVSTGLFPKFWIGRY